MFFKNTAVKIVHRLPAADDREAVGATMNLSRAQSQYLVTLAPGQAAVSVDGMDHPLLVMMPDGTAREAAAGADGTVSPATVTSARSGTCGADCIARPCTLRDMRTAQRTLDDHPGIALWAELAVLAHLTGWPMPIPEPPLLEVLRAQPSRLRDCALSHGVDTAVGSRAPLICARVSPPALASHVSTAMRARVARGMWMCLPQEPQWLAPGYQDTHQKEDAHQKEAARRPAGVVPRDADTARRVAFGLVAPSAVERAIGALAADDDFGLRLADHLKQFTECRWPHRYLTRADPDPRADRDPPTHPDPRADPGPRPP